MKLKFIILFLIIIITTTNVLAEDSWEEVSQIWDLVKNNKFNQVEKELEKVLKYKDKNRMYDIYSGVLVEFDKEAEYEEKLKLINKFYLKYHVKLAKYYFIKEDWLKFRKNNSLPLPFYERFLWRNSDLASTLEKLNKAYKYRKNSKFIKNYKNYIFGKYDRIIKSNIKDKELSSEIKLETLTMQGVAYYWEGNRKRAIKYLKSANNQDGLFRDNFLIDELAYYLARIKFEEKAIDYIDLYASTDKSDLSDEAHLLYRRIKAHLDKTKDK